MCSPWRTSACLAMSSRPSWTASMARRSQSCACLYSASAWSRSRFSSAMAEATCCLAFTSCPRMSARICVNIFSGSSAREMRSLMLDFRSEEKRSKMPMGSACLAVRAELAQVRCERERHALVAREKLFIVEGRKLERLGEHDLVVLDTVGAVQQVGRIQLEQPLGELGGARSVARERHDVHAQKEHGRRVVHCDGEIAVRVRSHDPESGFHLGIRGTGSGESDEKALDVVFREHRDTWRAGCPTYGFHAQPVSAAWRMAASYGWSEHGERSGALTPA